MNADEIEYPPDAPLEAYLRIAEEFHREDRLDLAMRVVDDAFKAKGWVPGLWTAFYNELRCEKDARDAALLRRVDDRLTIELQRDAPPSLFQKLRWRALSARQEVERVLSIGLSRPVMITVFLPDAPVGFIVGSYGYVSRKTELDKICLPYRAVVSPGELRDALEHEFTHVAVGQLGGKDVPHWLDEGLATYASGELSGPRAQPVIEKAAREKKMLRLSWIERTLNSADARKDAPADVTAAYYLAAGFVSFWVERHGIESVRGALAAMGEGASVEAAVRRSAGVSLSRLEGEWRLKLAQPSR